MRKIINIFNCAWKNTSVSGSLKTGEDDICWSLLICVIFADNYIASHVRQYSRSFGRPGKKCFTCAHNFAESYVTVCGYFHRHQVISVPSTAFRALASMFVWWMFVGLFWQFWTWWFFGFPPIRSWTGWFPNLLGDLLKITWWFQSWMWIQVISATSHHPVDFEPRATVASVRCH